MARDMLDIEEKVAASRRKWRYNSKFTWNPYAAVGSLEALLPLATTASKFECIALLAFSMQY